MGLTGEELRAKYGTARICGQVEAGAALRRLGIRGEVHPRDVVVCRYGSWEAARAFEAGNLEHHGHPGLGLYQDGDEVVGVTDLRAVHGVTADPGLADEAP